VPARSKLEEETKQDCDEAIATAHEVANECKDEERQEEDNKHPVSNLNDNQKRKN